MKRLFLIRHAKSSWEDASLSDFERPLNKRGKNDAPFMGNILSQQGVHADLIISSPAKRAFSTAKRIAKHLQYSIDRIEKDKSIYLSNPDTLLEIIKKRSEEVNTLMLVGHNPELTELANQLCDKHIENVPTCGIVCINFDVSHWHSIHKTNSKFEYFDFPKNYQHTS